MNAIIDSAYISAKTKQWEQVIIEDWRGSNEVKQQQYTSYDENFYLIKEEILPLWEKKMIVKNKITGSIESR